MKIGFFGALTLILIVLKLTGTIAISWVWCIAPLFIPLGIFLAIIGLPFVAIGVIAIAGWLKDKFVDGKSA